jgi:hypothetical protein
MAGANSLQKLPRTPRKSSSSTEGGNGLSAQSPNDPRPAEVRFKESRNMSHFTTLKTRIVSKEHLKQALDDLQIVFEEGDLEIRGYQGISTPVEIRIPTSNTDYQMGFRKQADAYELIADWYGIKDVDQSELLGRIMQRYAYRVTKEQLEQQDFMVVEEEVQADNTIRITVRRMT